ncbi:Flavin-containing monooxygenase FMO GS-OX-like 9 [Platanthera zijinensis]|uniref:Flavin-containing monooxygenase n=1 Tax=Platanthera zijinensis TaxID=2320716 RepID=A0AAP0AWU0_9ASPA
MNSKRVCVIGAGPSEQVSARELRKEGHSIVVLEQKHDVGEQWLCKQNVESEEAMANLTNPSKVHSSVYESLRLTSPREIMGFTDFPFVARKGRDVRRFPGHRELLLYLQDFCTWFEKKKMIRFNTWVGNVGTEDADHADHHYSMRWVVRAKELGTGFLTEEIFDVFVVANGHYSASRLSIINGMKFVFLGRYSYSLPFLDTKGVSIDDDRVGPLYEHTFPPSIAPSLSFVGIPRKIIGFPFFESQAKWISKVLSGKITLPPREEMMKSIKEYW